MEIENMKTELLYSRGDCSLLKWYSRYGAVFSVMQKGRKKPVYNCITLLQGIRYVDEQAEMKG